MKHSKQGGTEYEAVGKTAGNPSVAGCDPYSMGRIVSRSFSAVFFNLLAGMIFSVTVVSFFLGLVARMECLNILLVSFAIYIISHVGRWIVTRIAEINRRF